MRSPNQELGRRNHKIEGFVIHITEGSYESAVNWCMDPKSQVSYHFIVNRQGDVNCLVLPENTAWHAGKVKNPTAEIITPGSNPNLYTIGIALAGFASEPPTLQQIFGVASILRTLAMYFSIPLDKKTVITHNSIRSDKICPGPFVNIDYLLWLANLPI